jgi:nucleotide-binding universal stress UspA family protein
MPTLAVATDFSTRSDRALRRATLLARRHGGDLMLVHVIDDDQPVRIVDALHREARALLEELEKTVSEVDGIACRSEIRLGEPFQQIDAAAVEIEACLLVMGPHRRQVLRDQFRGTTVERTIRRARVPLLVANAVPAGEYGRVLLTTRMEPGAAEPLRQALDLKMLGGSEYLLLHVYDSPGSDMLGRSLAPGQERLAQEHEIQAKFASDVLAFAAAAGLGAARPIARPTHGRTEADILRISREESADLIVVSRAEKGILETILLGSVAEGVLRDAEQDVLVMPRGS